MYRSPPCVPAFTFKAASVTVQQYLVQFKVYIYIVCVHISMYINRTPFSISYTLRIEVFLFVPLPFVKCFFFFSMGWRVHFQEVWKAHSTLCEAQTHTSTKTYVPGNGHYTAVFRYTCKPLTDLQIRSHILMKRLCLGSNTLWCKRNILTFDMRLVHITLEQRGKHLTTHYPDESWWKQYHCVIFNYLIYNSWEHTYDETITAVLFLFLF